jgi:hypothetical protein
LALPFFALTLFVSAFLLFLVQPMIGKMILPRLGGAPQVWNTCQVFFQLALLAGYAYTHTASTRLPLRRQLVVHAILLFLPILVFLPNGPFNITGWVPPPGANPIPSTLLLLTMVVGVPFFVVATSAPLLQKWFSATGHPAAKDPYFLYGASNLGSMLALLAYPFVVEPFVLLRGQASTWAFGYGLLLVLVLLCAYLVRKLAPLEKLALAGAPAGAPMEGEPVPPPVEEPAAEAPVPAPPATAAKSTAIKKPPRHQPRPGLTREKATESVVAFSDEVTPMRRLRWIGLAAVPSSLMLGITTHITTDLSPIPLIWLVPLTLYLLSFILVFSRWPVVWTDKPHTAIVYAHPVAMALMVYFDIWASPRHEELGLLVFFLVLGFFWTAMLCHGELARDRPSPRHLTEFYLWMSVGGAVGGMFNGLFAPVIFPGIWEFPIAMFVAGLLRPKIKEGGWTDDLASEFLYSSPAPVQPKKGHKHQPKSIAKTGPGPSLHMTLDFVLPLALLILGFVLATVVYPRKPEGRESFEYVMIFGLPLLISCFYLGRPLRYGLAVGAVLVIAAVDSDRGQGAIYSTRSYFGVIRVFERAQEMGGKTHFYTNLLHGTTDHGMNFKRPKDKKLWNNPQEDFSRLATTYYHQMGPVGRAMEKFNWFKDKMNHFNSDARMPTALAAAGAAAAGPVGLPVDALASLWTEPPYATIGLGTGTMASYGRPFQHVDFYEIDNVIRGLSLPPPGKLLYFNYLHEAQGRGAIVNVRMGDARTRMAMKYEDGGGPDNFYHLMVVDAFSSDAIPVHLITKEAIAMYFTKLAEEGVLCVHTSNRHVDLVKVVADVADSLHLFCLRGNDRAPGDSRRIGHYMSTWVMVARKREYLHHLNGEDQKEFLENYLSSLEQDARAKGFQFNRIQSQYWREPQPTTTGTYVWTDDYSNLIAVLRRRGAEED